MTRREEIINHLLSNPTLLLEKEPFYRDVVVEAPSMSGGSYFGEKATVQLPRIRRKVIDQSQYLKEFNVMSHTILTDENIPSVCVKTQQHGFQEISEIRIPIPWQEVIKDKHVLHLCVNRMDFTLLDTEPSEQTQKDFITFKQRWLDRNMEGAKTQMVDTQETVGDVGLLFYYDHEGKTRTRILRYPEYTIITHKDDNGLHLLECVYYQHGDNECIDCYDDKYHYRLTHNIIDGEVKKDGELAGWYIQKELHGFSECPLITKRGKVAWDNVQTIIEMYETLFNIFYVIQKRHGWGILYIKGKFKDTGKRLAGNVILNDTTLDNTTSDAKFLSAPSPQGTIDTLNALFEQIQIGSGVTILLPKDIKTGGDLSGITIQLIQSRDLETANKNVVEWQNVANKMCRLFKEGISKELVNEGDETAITRFAENLHISAKFKVWRPYSETEFNQMLVTLKGGGLISRATGIECNTISKPDEVQRIMKEAEEALQQMQETKTNTNTETNKHTDNDVSETTDTNNKDMEK